MHAGVIARLQARDPWRVLAFRPGRDPIGALARAVIHVSGESNASPIDVRLATLRAELRDTPTLLAAQLAALSRARGLRVLVAVDQLEEAFTQGDPGEAARLLQILLACADDAADPVRVVFTVRDDFVGRLAGVRSLFVIQKLEPQALHHTIVCPLERFGYTFDDPRNVDDLIAEVGSTVVADLPLLQFACRTLWDGRDRERKQLQRARYIEMGGVAGALARHAARALAELPAGSHSVARQLLLQRVAGNARRTVPRSALVAMVGARAEPVLDRLIAARLLVQRRAGDGDGSSVEIAHDSLIETWSQLARWLDESRDERRVLEDLDSAASLWERRGNRPEETWAGTERVAVRHRGAQLGLTLPRRLEVFLQVGEARHRKQQRRRRQAFAAAAVVGALAVTGGTLMLSRYLAREQLIRTNAGTVDLTVLPYDWIDGAPRAVEVSQLPDLHWTLYAARADDANEPGDPLPADVVEVLERQRGTDRITWRVRAPGGAAFVAIEGRGRRGEHCPPSWIRIRAFTGYAGAGSPPMQLIVPTCQVSERDLVRNEAGPIVYGGPGEPASSHDGDADYTQPERTVTLPAFSLDRTEVSNGAFAPFACGASPYGVLNLAGNVQEWVDRKGQTDTDPLYALRGGAADSPVELEHITTVYRNHRDPRRFDYSVGFRCASTEENNRRE